MFLAQEHGVDCGLLKEVEHINLQRVALFVKKVRRAVWVLQGKKETGCAGLGLQRRNRRHS
jgi:UDP-glucose 6-dehydrogenase